MIRPTFRRIAFAAAIASAWALSASAQAAPLLRGADGDVVEVLTTVTRLRPAAPWQVPVQAAGQGAAGVGQVQALPNQAAALGLARTAIDTARQTGDARYWGRAQAALLPWWNAPNAPAALAVMQATVQQGRHEFARAEAVLESVLGRESNNMQAWLNLAALQRLAGRYVEALQSCGRLAPLTGAGLYAQVCTLETRSLQGQHAASARSLRGMIAQTRDDSVASWMLSLLAENEERAGLDDNAHAAYEASTARMPDLYTAIAHSDLLLRTGKPQAALGKLSGLPASDAVVLRRAIALKRLGNKDWVALRDELRERDLAQLRRGDDPLLHAREGAMVALWLEGDPTGALRLAQANLKLQREPIDWWLALHCAFAAGNAATSAQLQAQIRSLGLADARLAAAVRGAAPGQRQ